MTDITKQTEDELRATIIGAQSELKKRATESRVVNLPSVRGFNTRLTFRTNANGFVSWSVAVGQLVSDLTLAEAKVLQKRLNEILGEPAPLLSELAPQEPCEACKVLELGPVEQGNTRCWDGEIITGEYRGTSFISELDPLNRVYVPHWGWVPVHRCDKVREVKIKQ